MSRKGHVALRTCVGCGERDAQNALLRFAHAPQQGLRLRTDAGSPGRSAYLHHRRDCWQRFVARKGVVRSLGRPVDKNERLAFIEVIEQFEASIR